MLKKSYFYLKRVQKRRQNTRHSKKIRILLCLQIPIHFTYGIYVYTRIYVCIQKQLTLCFPVRLGKGR